MRFAEFFPEKAGEIEINRFSPESLAQLPYALELELKNKALKALLREGKITAPLIPLIASPRERNYRTTGKRRVTYNKGKLFFHMGKTHGREAVAQSVLESPGHQEIYNFCHKKLHFGKQT